MRANYLQNTSFKSIIKKVTTMQFHIRQVQHTDDLKVSGLKK